jgi:hypothetical protein
MSRSLPNVLDTVTVLVPPAGSGLARGQVGVVVDLAGENALVEFADAEGRTVATAALPVASLLVLKYELEPSA